MPKRTNNITRHRSASCRWALEKIARLPGAGQGGLLLRELLLMSYMLNLPVDVIVVVKLIVKDEEIQKRPIPGRK
jgi:hypothetical protein